jgi:hypothetical protein
MDGFTENCNPALAWLMIAVWRREIERAPFGASGGGRHPPPLIWEARVTLAARDMAGCKGLAETATNLGPPALALPRRMCVWKRYDACLCVVV